MTNSSEIIKSLQALNPEDLQRLFAQLAKNLSPEELSGIIIAAKNALKEQGEYNPVGQIIKDDSGNSVYMSDYERNATSACGAIFCEVDKEKYVLMTNKPALGYVLIGGYFQPKISGKTGNHDKTIEACFVREVREETGLTIKLGKLKPVGCWSNFKKKEANETFHSNIHFFAYDLGAVRELPKTKPGDDVDNLTWVKLKDINVMGKSKIGSTPIIECSYEGTNIYGPHSYYLNKAIETLEQRTYTDKIKNGSSNRYFHAK